MKHRRKIITTGALWSEKLASINHAAERLYWRIYMASDNHGVMSGKAWDVCQQAAPGVSGFNRDTVLQAIDALVGIGLLERWEVDGSTFIYVIGHDEHQSADFIRKRGRMRRTPMPPSQLAELAKPASSSRAAKGSEGQIPSADAEVCPSGAQGSLSTTTSTSISTSIPTTTPPAATPLGAVRSVVSSGSPEDRYEAEAAAKLDVQRPATPLAEIRAAQDRIEGLLAEVFVDPTDAHTMAHTIASTKRRQAIGRPPRVFDIACWERAVRVLHRQVLEEGRTVSKDPMGLIVAMVPSYEAEGSDRKVLMRAVSTAPAGPKVESAEQILARFNAAAGSEAAS